MQYADDIRTAESGVARAGSVAREFAAQVRTQFGDRVRLIRLYGSAARGDWMPDSDIDVLVLLDRVLPEDADWMTRRAFVLGVLEHGVVLQPLFLSEDDFRALRDRERRFALDVDQEGISL